MRDFLQKAFGGDDDGLKRESREEGDVRIAACALFLEMANIDNEFAEEERQQILSMLQDEFGVSQEHATEMAREAAAQLEGATDMWRFTNLVNENYSREEKSRVVELLWQVVYADGRLDAHEDYLMHRMGKLLRLTHRELIAAKLRVLERGGEGE
jgi:uncharacterized tellurite resistance protein B-like protein